MTATNPGTTNLVSWWALEENGGTAYDSHGSNHLTEVSGAIPAVTGKVGNGRDFEAGDTEYLEIADNASLSFGDEGFAIGFWAKIESTDASNYRGALGKYDTATGKREYLFYIPTGTTKFTFIVSSDGTVGNAHSATITNNIGTGTWAFIMGWHDPDANKVYISVNNGTPVETAHSGGCFNSTAPFRIGQYTDNTHHFDGVIDEPAIFRSVLTADERTWWYNDGNGRSYSELAQLDNAYLMNWW
jgi:hypothetical protein